MLRRIREQPFDRSEHPLFLIALAAADHKIAAGAASAAGDGHDMIQRKLAAGEFVPAVMADTAPQQFLKGLAKTRPELRGVDLNDLEGSARSIAKQKGVDYETVKGQALNTIQKIM